MADLRKKVFKGDKIEARGINIDGVPLQDYNILTETESDEISDMVGDIKVIITPDMLDDDGNYVLAQYSDNTIIRAQPRVIPPDSNFVRFTLPDGWSGDSRLLIARVDNFYYNNELSESISTVSGGRTHLGAKLEAYSTYDKSGGVVNWFYINENGWNSNIIIDSTNSGNTPEDVVIATCQKGYKWIGLITVPGRYYVDIDLNVHDIGNFDTNYFERLKEEVSDNMVLTLNDTQLTKETINDSDVEINNNVLNINISGTTFDEIILDIWVK